MKKLIAFTLAILAIAAVTVSCSTGGDGGKDTAKTTDAPKTTESKAIDVNAIASKLVAEGDFEGELEQIQGVEYVYSDLPAGVEAAVYQSTAYSDEVAVFKTTDVETIKSVVEAYVAARVATFKDYAPDQSTKADENAAIVAGDGVVVLVISQASAADAKTLIEKAIG